ncbi:asparagine-rich protein-like [Limulus polyphemus]|uniref:Asparagine-rich protein-like n=1 Tax=Limulus polyphemus TaxID=6850 RepID=A0ABM1BK68_LIMPO|nr:asparagine-rich protein-like [Limulus polyphemus]
MTTRDLVTFIFWIVLLPLSLGGAEAAESKATDVDVVYKNWQLPERLQKKEFPIGVLNAKWKTKFPNKFSELNLINLLRHFEEEKRAKDYEQSLQNEEDDERKRGHTLIHFGKRNVDLEKKTGKIYENLDQKLQRPEPDVFPYYIEYAANNLLEYLNQQNGKNSHEDHSKIHFGNRFKSNPEDKSRSMVYFTKKSFENILKELNEKQKIAKNVKGRKQSSGHTIMSFGKRLYSKRSYNNNQPNHQMNEFVNYDNEPNHHLIHIRKKIYNNHRPDHHMLLFGKRINDERPGHNTIYLGKALDNKQQNGHNMMYFGKRMNNQPNGHNMMYFGKRMDKEQQSGHNMMYFGKRMDKEQQSGHHLTYFEKRMKSDKQPVRQIMYFIDEEKLPDSQMTSLGKKNDDDSTPSHQIMHFGKRREVNDDETANDDIRVESKNVSENGYNMFSKRSRNTRYQDNYGSSFSRPYGRGPGLLDDENNPFDYSWFKYAEDINRSKQLLSPNLEEISDNRNVDENRVASNTDVLPEIMHLFRDQEKALKKSSYSMNHFEKRSVKIKEATNAHSSKYDDSKDPPSKSLVYSNKFDSNEKLKPEDKNNVAVDGSEQKRNDSLEFNRVQKNTFVSDGTTAEIVDSFPGYYILPSREDDNSDFNKLSYGNYDLFPFRLEESFLPLVTKKGQSQYPDVQYYFIEDRGSDKLENERNAFLHFGKR